MPASRALPLPPIADVPLMVPCPRCGRVLRTTVSFRTPPPTRRLACPWCTRTVVVRAPRSRPGPARTAVRDRLRYGEGPAPQRA